MSETYFTIVNGAAGGGRCRARADQVLMRLRQEGLDLDVRLTAGPGHATELAREAHEEGHRRFLSVGGDGTSFEIVNGLFPNDGGPVTLGMLPLGTGNSFLRDYGITSEEAAFDAIRRGRGRRCDVVRVEHGEGSLHFINILSIGFTAHAGDLTNRRFKRLGAGGYVLSVVASVARLHYPIDPIRLDGSSEVDRRPAAFLSFNNSRYTGGSMMMAPTADAGDGLLDVIRVGALPRGRFLAAFPKIFQGTHVDLPDVEELKVRRVDFVEERRQPVMVDGEIVSLSLRSLEVVPGALEVLA